MNKNGTRIKLFSNEKFTKVANDTKLDTADKISENQSIANTRLPNGNHLITLNPRLKEIVLEHI